jgi:hypothetical protein
MRRVYFEVSPSAVAQFADAFIKHFRCGGYKSEKKHVVFVLHDDSSSLEHHAFASGFNAGTGVIFHSAHYVKTTGKVAAQGTSDAGKGETK